VPAGVVPGPQGVAGANRGPRGQGRAQGKQQQPGGKLVPGMPMQQIPGQQPIRYAENVRNVRTAGPGGMQMMPQQAAEIAMPAPHEPLTIKALAAAPEEMRKQMIGERLFPLIKVEQPNLAGKITGMLLEMDNGELIHLLESQAALHEKIQEAMQVLQAHPESGEAEETDDKQ
jgi:polyadenylate-binding protein